MQEVTLRANLKLKSISMLLAFLASFLSPLSSINSAEAQVRSGSRELSRQNVRSGQSQRGRHATRPHRTHVNRTQVRPHTRPNVHRSRAHVRPHRSHRVVVVHPRRHWNRGGAMAAGAAMGFVAGAAAVSLAGSPPRAGYCWFYTTPQRTTGFWDWCPR
jgi:hypothetical protein